MHWSSDNKRKKETLLCKSECVCRAAPLPPATPMKLDNCQTTTRHTPDTNCSLSHDSFFTHSIIVLFRRASHTQHRKDPPFPNASDGFISYLSSQAKAKTYILQMSSAISPSADLATGYHLLALFFSSKCCFVFPCKFVCLSGFGKLYCSRLGNVENCRMKKITSRGCM